MAATAEISKPSSSVLFTSARDGLRLTKEQRYPVYGPSGAKVGEQPGKALRFQDGALRVDESGVDMADGGRLPAAEALEFLRGHRLFGDKQEGFWEVQQAAPPVSQAELEALMNAAWEATTTVSEGPLSRLIDAEEAGWARESLLAPAREHLEKLRAKIAELGIEPEPAPKRPARGR